MLQKHRYPATGQRCARHAVNLVNRVIARNDLAADNFDAHGAFAVKKLLTWPLREPVRLIDLITKPRCLRMFVKPEAADGAG